jgi:citrate lyase beta subunit
VGGLQLALEVTQGLEELFLARHALGDVELAADLAGRIEQRHLMAALGATVAAARPAGPAPTTAIFLIC